MKLLRTSLLKKATPHLGSTVGAVLPCCLLFLRGQFLLGMNKAEWSLNWFGLLWWNFLATLILRLRQPVSAQIILRPVGNCSAELNLSDGVSKKCFELLHVHNPRRCFFAFA